MVFEIQYKSKYETNKVKLSQLSHWSCKSCLNHYMFSDGISKHAYYYMIEIEMKNLLMILGYQSLKWYLLKLHMLK